MAQAPSYGKAATASTSRATKKFPAKKAKPQAPKQPPMPPVEQQVPSSAGIAQQILGPRSVRRSEY